MPERDILVVGRRSICAFEDDDRLFLTRHGVREKNSVASVPYRMPTVEYLPLALGVGAPLQILFGVIYQSDVIHAENISANTAIVAEYVRYKLLCGRRISL